MLPNFASVWYAERSCIIRWFGTRERDKLTPLFWRYNSPNAGKFSPYHVPTGPTILPMHIRDRKSRIYIYIESESYEKVHLEVEEEMI